jgi:Acetyltransferase (GNAT) domain
MRVQTPAKREDAVRPTVVQAKKDRGSEQRSSPFAHNRPEVVQMRALQGLFDARHKATTQAEASGAEVPGEVVQRVEREAQVTWATTHLVRERDYGKGESLFGPDGDWQAAEVPPEELGQLSHGQRIVVDDEAVFLSRRGANQENPARRQEDREIDELRHRWLRVLLVEVDGKFQPVGEHVYVRAETIQLLGVQKPGNKKIDVLEHGKDDDSVSGNLQGFEAAWQAAATKRRRSVGRVNQDYEGQTVDGVEITSGWNWDKYDEGVDVSRYIKDPEERLGFSSSDERLERQKTFSANYKTGEGSEADPVAYMVLEVRQPADGPRFMYIRWLLGHPEKGGGGTALVRKAIEEFKACEDCEELRVDSAFSAVKWYESFGFQAVDPEQVVVKKGVGYADTALVIKK